MHNRRDKNGLTEEEYLASYKPGNYPRPSLTADLVIVARSGNGLKLLLIERGGHPYLGCRALPGGFAEPGETIEETAARELEEETGLTGIPLQPVGLFSKPGRDPRGWTVSQVFTALLDRLPEAKAGDDAASLDWWDVSKVGDGAVLLTRNGEQLSTRAAGLAFDHGEMIERALRLLDNSGFTA